jgi:hypothetical protein
MEFDPGETGDNEASPQALQAPRHGSGAVGKLRSMEARGPLPGSRGLLASRASEGRTANNVWIGDLGAARGRSPPKHPCLLFPRVLKDLAYMVNTPNGLTCRACLTVHSHIHCKVQIFSPITTREPTATGG